MPIMRSLAGLLLLLATSVAAFNVPHARRSHVRSVTSARHLPLVSMDRLAEHIQTRWEKLIGHAATERIAEVAGSESLAEKMVAARDNKLAVQDTRKWCVDRCLATGYCDAIEDILEMTTAQVHKFCEECASLDECELDVDHADTYMNHLYQAARDADGSSYCYG